MTRDKEIQKAAKEIAQDIEDWEIAEDIEDAFMEGALWADRTMIDKACEWLHSALYLDHEHSIEHRYATLEELLNDFRKAMKGGKK
ncbi:MAG: hypothetical protein IKS36_05380 [Bacteroidales bacterium]|nr:hypothetical protein [Bacteroidales bacterium]